MIFLCCIPLRDGHGSFSKLIETHKKSTALEKSAVDRAPYDLNAERRAILLLEYL